MAMAGAIVIAQVCAPLVTRAHGAQMMPGSRNPLT